MSAPSDTKAADETTTEVVKKNIKHKNMDKPWDTPDINKWEIPKVSAEDNLPSFLEESSFAILFPQYREKYLSSVWGEVKGSLKPFGIEAELNLTEGSMTVRTTRKTWDPYAIIKARDFMKLLARSVPYPQAVKILEDEMHCDVMKISGYVRNKERFAKRRQRLVGPNGSTLKALEILTNCHILVQGQTVSMMGGHKGLKIARRVIEDCMNNIHPVYHIKELMIRKELEKDDTLNGENWDRFLPQFKKKCVQRRKTRDERKAAAAGGKPVEKVKTLFPALPTPRKEDLLIESGEYFHKDAEEARRSRKEARKEARK